MPEDRDGGATPFWPPFLRMVGIRATFLAGTALTLLWAPTRHDFPPFRAYEAHTDLIFESFAQWDAGWFLRIAGHGYDSAASTAFFPLYPLVVRGVGVLLGSKLVAAVCVSLLAAGIAAVFVYRLAVPLVGTAVAWDAVLLLALYPSAMVFTSAYADALFLALSAGCLYAALRDRPWLAGVLGGLAVATRFVGLALVPPLLVLLWPRGRSAHELLRPAPLLCFPAAVVAYAAYLDHRFGDPFEFVHALDRYWQRHTSWLGPLRGLWESLSAGYHGTAELLLHLPRGLGAPGGFPHRDQLAAQNALQALLLLAALWLTWVAWRRLGRVLGLYAISTMAFLLSSPVDVTPLASFPRYLLADFPLFIALAAELRDHPRAREPVVIGFAAMAGAAAVGFSRHVWIA
jgi:4-amino-4-deoxy-L-arabinose transferase-like glycosyltransferase